MLFPLHHTVSPIHTGFILYPFNFSLKKKGTVNILLLSENRGKKNSDEQRMSLPQSDN